MGLEFTEENWQECLETLGFTEQRNPNGKNCWDVYDEKGTPRFQYESDEEQEKLYWFLSGAVYWQVHTMSSQSTIDKAKEITLQRLCTKAVEHCIELDYDSIVSEYDSWDEYLMEMLGSTEQEVKNCGIKLRNLWN